ncbi:MAG: heme ABC exporter ATP-binding protein CcmA [Alphaproteobacteria bacterium]|nr:heme ABC exporter ATP-binding protein CcmA [Alphaproteobacteria bacterium]
MHGVAIEFDQVARRFGPRWALGGITLSIGAGEGVMLTGPNGSGKSTLLRCLSTALKIHHGEIRVGGQELWANRQTIRPSIGFLSHAGYLYDDLSGADNLRVWAKLGGMTADPHPLLERVGLPPKRLDPVRTYSQGMRRRLALARLMLQKPKIVLLDEPYTALDADGRRLVTDLAREFRESGATLLMATHLVSYASEACDRHIALLDGKLVDDAPVETE